MENKRYLSVTAINRYLNAKIDSDTNLKNMPIQGEISNARISKGHLYFVLKDEYSEISAIMFSNNVQGLDFKVEDGMKVIVRASLQLYEKKGTYSLLVYEMKEFGMGLLYQEFLKLKEKLSKEGLFDESHKKPIPKYSEKIGLITSATGDAKNDVVSTISKRFPLATIYLYPALVQGADAPSSIIDAINRMEEDGLVDVCIIARGGGSFEDLSCFNDEELARTIYNASTPIVSGVGHEPDFTICDFVSDLRAPTPTGAAVLVTENKEVILTNLANYRLRTSDLIFKMIESKDNLLENALNSHYFKNFGDYLAKYELKLAEAINHLDLNSPLTKVNSQIEKIEFLDKRLENINLISKIDTYQKQISDNKTKINSCVKQVIYKHEKDLLSLVDKTIILNPLNLISKGYSITYKDDKVVTSVKEVNNNEIIKTKLIDGEIISIVKEVEK